MFVFFIEVVWNFSTTDLRSFDKFRKSTLLCPGYVLSSFTEFIGKTPNGITFAFDWNEMPFAD